MFFFFGRAEWQFVKTIEKSPKENGKKGECVWSIEQGFDGLEDYEEVKKLIVSFLRTKL